MLDIHKSRCFMRATCKRIDNLRFQTTKIENVSLPANDFNLLLELATILTHKPDLSQDGLER